ncbi:murein transglycosylase A [Crenalkalicoccus roseus]|uniref:murein transglycosylase A n=1 Tax=Crenalkalicoccus roseus TaxID=1485588 RepID=UPI001F00338D|nr:MltA domain-containing protein [Crenalkalicoccus roseus]
MPQHKRRGDRRRFLAAFLLLMGGGAAQASSPRPVPHVALPGWTEDSPSRALPPLLATCARLDDTPARSLGGAGILAQRGGAPALWREACAEAASLAAILPEAPPAREAAVRAFLERRFEAFALGTGLLTGYYEPELRGALRPGGPYRVPLRAPPPPGTPLPERAAIEAGALDGLGLELAWVDDPVDAFFLQIQGSGRVRLAEGGVLRLGYAGRNGHPYRSIGRLLIERGEIAREAMSMQAIRAWLAAAPPEQARAVLHHNPAYIFFRPVEGLAPEQGPVGTLGVPLTPRRSLAVDPAFVPLGAPVWIAARDPLDGAPLRRLVVAQDTGSAIRGPARGDLFWGWGEEAEARAGLMREPAEMFVLVPRPSVPSAAEGGGLD